MSYIQSNTETNGTLSTLIEQGNYNTKQQINVMDLGKVIEDGEDLYSSYGFSSKNIELQRTRYYVNQQGVKSSLSKPILVDVPTRGIANVGDIVIVIYANCDIAGVFGLTEEQSSNFNHSINNGIAIGKI